ncbi:sporulation protein [Halalkalibacter nanhaiisediminis]|uniref:SpoOM protein n=1 Tax=Halalkalibacter nanhaiisediminis TaxID=688079 RepID=A0A562QDH0_9BACI|nr:sporulation protein [Halalkalibacter nanhaiisediminis]TWI54076.1 SpoOM protein [Halalkalibacter nanhaiisediminis]
MFNKYLNLFKLGSANIDLVLDAAEYLPGERVSGYFKLQGGFRKQKVKRLECDLIAQNKHEKSNQMIETVKTILMSRTLNAKESTEIPFNY